MQGRFRVAGLRGGMYRLMAGNRALAVRVWARTTAPPGARQLAVVNVGDTTIRGQTPIPDYFRSDAFLIAAVVVGAIAIPIAIHNFRNDHPDGS